MSFVPIGLKNGLVVGALLAAASAGTGAGDVENHYVTVGTACAIILAVAVSAWNVGGKFRQILDFMKESKEDRDAIHKALSKADTDTSEFRQQVQVRLGSIDSKISTLPCKGKDQDCPERTTDPND